MKVLMIPAAGILPINILDRATRERLLAGLRLWRSGEYEVILVTGGICQPPHEQTQALAVVMRSWLITQGVAPHCILTEERSLDTFQNIAFSLDVLRAYTQESLEITVVSHWQHCLRFRCTFWMAHGLHIKLYYLPYQHESLLQSFRRFLLENAFLLVHVMDPHGKGKIASGNRQKRTYPRPT